MNYNGEASDGKYWDEVELHKSFGDRGVNVHGRTRDVDFPCWKKFGNECGTTGPEKPEWFDDEWDWKKMSDDMEKYYTGKSKYIKGKGWE